MSTKPTKVGEKVYLKLQLDQDETDLFPQAIIVDESGAPIVGSPVSLSHSANGLYLDDSLSMPAKDEVIATYRVYDDSGHTKRAFRYATTIDVFYRDFNAETLNNIESAVNSLLAGGLPGDLTGYIVDEGLLDGAIIDSQTIMGEIFEDGQLVGFIEELELTGYIFDTGELVGYVPDC